MGICTYTFQHLLIGSNSYVTIYSTAAHLLLTVVTEVFIVLDC